MDEYKDKNKYMETLMAQIRHPKVRELVAEEIADHIDLQADYYKKIGYEQTEALQKALQKMGDPVEIGVQLDRVHRPKIDWQIFTIIFLLSGIGIFMSYTIARVAPQYTALFPKQVLYVLFGSGVLWAICMLDYSILGKYPVQIWWIFWTITATLFLLFGTSVNGAHKFLWVWGGTHIPLYACYLFAVPLYAGVVYRFRGTGILGILQCGVCYFIPAVFALTSSDFHTFALFSISSFSLFAFGIVQGFFTQSGKRKWILLGSIFASASLAVLLLLLWDPRFHYLLERFIALTDITADPQAAEYVPAAIHTALSNARLWGTSVSAGAIAPDSSSIFFQIPALETDYLFAFLIVRYGILAGTLTVSFLFFLLARAFAMAFRQKNILGRMIAFGCAVVLSLQTLAYILPNIGVALLSPRSFPFLSGGFSVMLCNMAIAGILLSIKRNSSIINQAPTKNNPALFHWNKETRQIIIQLGHKEL